MKKIEPQGKIVIEVIDKALDSMKKYPNFFGEDKIKNLQRIKHEVMELYQGTP
jgi:hypothetical protein